MQEMSWDGLSIEHEQEQKIQKFFLSDAQIAEVHPSDSLVVDDESDQGEGEEEVLGDEKGAVVGLGAFYAGYDDLVVDYAALCVLDCACEGDGERVRRRIDVNLEAWFLPQAYLTLILFTPKSSFNLTLISLLRLPTAITTLKLT